MAELLSLSRAPRRRAREVTTAVVLVGLLAGCSGADSAGDGSPLPLSREFAEIQALLSGDSGEDASAAQAAEVRVQDQIAVCMKDAGFDYVPAVAPDVDQAYSQARSEISDEEFARQYGYEITTGADTPMQAQANAAVAGWVDPNESTVAAMSQAERDEYWQALNGEPLADGSGVDETQGCEWQARQAIEAQSAELAVIEQDPRFSEISVGILNIETQVRQDPRMVEVDEQWSSCMAGAGFPDLVNSSAAQEAIMEMAYEEVDGVWSPRELSSDETSRIRELEIATATADYECKQDVHYWDTYRSVRADLEQQFIDANRSDLDAYKDAYMIALGSGTPQP